jgi:predicted nucleic acid-binding protein
MASSGLLWTEALRACRRYGGEEVRRARDGLAGLALLPVDERILEAAAYVEPAGLRSLDAIHLATAISLGDGLGAVYAYDQRLQEAATAAGLRVEAPA